MDAILTLIAEYGYPLLGGIVFLEAVGFPVPAAPALLAVGAACAKGVLSPGPSLAIALSAMMSADILLFYLGRKTGWWLLGLLCRVSINPEGCIYSSAAQFYKRGRTALLVAKFLPGLNTMAPPIAGSMNMPAPVFLRYDFGGASLYILTYGTLGYLFSGAIGMIAEWLSTLGTAVVLVAILALGGYFGYRFWSAYRLRKSDTVPRVEVEELARVLGSDVVIADVRSHGYYDERSERIRGSIRLEPNSLPGSLLDLPQGRSIYVYCSCQQEATSQRVAQMLRQGGFEAKVLRGGLSAWKKAGKPLERVPADDVVQLPRFR